jgi:hypothetical protein
MAIRITLLPVALILGLVAGVQSAQAALVTYCGPNVCYRYEATQVALTAAYFGGINFIGDSFYFLPTQFEARSADGVGINSGTNTDTRDTTLQFDRVYTVNAANEIASILAYEEGDYEINYAAGEVHGDLYVRIRGMNNPLEVSNVVTDAFDQVGAPFGLQLWDMSATSTPQATLTQLANNMILSIQNTLTAFTNDTTAGSELAWIEKKLTVTVTTTNPVPVPAGLWLLGSGFGLLALARRRVLSA